MCRHTERILCIHLIMVQVTCFAGPKTPAKHVGLRKRLCNHHGCYLTKSPLSSTWSKVLLYKVIEHSLSSTMVIVSTSPSQCLTGTVVSPREYYFRLRTSRDKWGWACLAAVLDKSMRHSVSRVPAVNWWWGGEDYSCLVGDRCAR